jgi:hypothetical protein
MTLEINKILIMHPIHPVAKLLKKYIRRFKSDNKFYRRWHRSPIYPLFKYKILHFPRHIIKVEIRDEITVILHTLCGTYYDDYERSDGFKEYQQQNIREFEVQRRHKTKNLILDD